MHGVDRHVLLIWGVLKKCVAVVVAVAAAECVAECVAVVVAVAVAAHTGEIAAAAAV